MRDFEIDLSVRPVRRGDYFVVFSDGLSNCMEAEEMGEFAIDTETSSLDPHQAKLVGISISNTIGKACYMPINHVDYNNLNEEKI